MADSAFWDARYGEGDESYAYGKEPNDFLVSVIKKSVGGRLWPGIPPGGTVLCIAEGEGRNAAFLASQGYRVTAVDYSSVGLRKARNLAKSRGMKIETICADLTEFEIGSERYDAVVSVFCHLPPELRRTVFAKCALALRVGGALILEAYNPRQVGRGTGGPHSTDLMMTELMLREDLGGAIAFLVLRECDRDVQEGQYHNGLSSVVQMLGIKRNLFRKTQNLALGLAPKMPLLPITSPETVQMCASLPLSPEDVFICSYPKSGTTWMQHIVISLLMRHRMNSGMSDGKQQIEPLEYEHVGDYAPFFEVDQHWDAQRCDLIQSIQDNHTKLGRRVFNTHLWWKMLPQSIDEVGPKYIYLTRSPMDVVVSFFHHLSSQSEGGYDGSFESFFDSWIHGDIAFGSWVDHILSFAPAFVESMNRQNIILVSYEEMLVNLKKVVEQLVDFLCIKVTPEDIDEMLPTFTFSCMKSDLNKFQPRSVTWTNNFKFLRKGVSGDSLTTVTDDQRSKLKELIEKENFVEKMKDILRKNPDIMEKFSILWVY